MGNQLTTASQARRSHEKAATEQQTIIPKRILIDIDGTIADWEQQFLNRMEQANPHVKTFPHGTRTAKDWPQQEEIRKLPETQAVLRSSTFYSTLQWLPDAKQALQQLIADGHDVQLCSTPSKTNPTSASEKYEWVLRELGEQWVERLTLTYRKDLIDADFLIDDHVHERTEHTRWEQILYVHRYNEHNRTRLRLHGWSDYKALTELLQS